MRLLLACAVIGAAIGRSSAQTAAPSYVFSTLAGRPGTPGAVDGVGANARFNRPWGVAVDAEAIYIADAANFLVRKVTPEGVVSTVAGQPGTAGTLDGPVASALFGTIVGTPSPTGLVLAGPFGVAVGAGGNLFVADSYSQTLRQVNANTGVATFAGAANVPGTADGAAAGARFSVPWGIAADAAGVLYVADSFNHVIRRISTNGVVTTIAGSVGDWGSADGIGGAARFFYPTGIAVDAAGKVYVSDSSNTIRRIAPLAPTSDLWEVTTLAGTAGAYGSTDGTGAAARFGSLPTSPTGGPVIRSPSPTPVPPTMGSGLSYVLADLPGLAADAAGNVFVCDAGNNLIRMITPAGVVTTIGGSTSAGSADGVGTNARFSHPMGIAVDTAGNLYVADSSNTIRKGTPGSAPRIQTQPADQTIGVGGMIELAVVASGVPVPNYQWRRNGVSLAGATAATLVLTNVQLSQAGNYTVTITNLIGGVSSSTAILTVTNAPVISVHPASQTVVSGQNVTLAVTASGSPTLAFQWLRDGVPIAGATNASLVLTNVQASTVGDYSVRVSNSVAMVTSDVARITLNTGRIVNLSIRSPLTGGEPLIVGFVATGGPKPLLVRAVGPTLRSFDVGGAMADPQLTLHTGASVSATNDNWGTGAAVAQLAQAAVQVGAFALPADSLDAAVLVTALDNAVTAEATAKNNAGGIVLVELYDAAPAAGSRLINVSARARVGTGENALFAGFVLAGTGTRTLLIRAVGPTLGAFGVNGVLNDPKLDLFAGGAKTPLASNDNWGGTPALMSAFRAVGAFVLPATESKDAVLLLPLTPGAYSVQVSGVGNTTGEVLLEIYDVP